MSIFTILTTLSIFVTVVQATPTDYIIGGDQAAVGDYPYFVEMAGCAGALIEPDTVLFAAHCPNGLGHQVIVGAYERGTLNDGGIMRYCEQYVPHPGYDGINNDFALCKLDSPVELDDDKVTLQWNRDGSVPGNDDNLIVMGLGATAEGGDSATYLQKLEVPVVSQADCRRPIMYGSLITDQMLCAGLEEGGKDSCQGDSGGPIVKREDQGDGTFVDIHVGVVSFGEGCARPNKPGVYARTSAVTNWIETTMCNDFNSVASECNNSPTPPPTCEAELDILVRTDTYGYETSWSLKKEASGEEIATRSYKIAFFGNSHSICVEKNTCYNFNITDSYGDGMCYNDDCGLYELKTPNQQPFKQGARFGAFETTRFCIDDQGNKVDELVLNPIVGSESEDEQVECKDEKGFSFQGGRGCGFVSRKRFGKRKRLCKKEVRKNKIVADHCLKSCGEVGIGECKHMKKPKRGLN